jgi:hypothetical protein
MSALNSASDSFAASFGKSAVPERERRFMPCVVAACRKNAADR